MKWGVVVCAVLVASAAGCSARGGAGSTGEEAPTSQCVDNLTVDGETWTAWPLSARLEREVAGTPRAALQTACDDVEGDASESPQQTEVALWRIEGIRGSHALFRQDVGYHDVVYVPGDQATEFAELPRQVRLLIKHG